MKDSRCCFVIMPYGKKRDSNGNEIDFDAVYRELIQEPIESLDLTPVRCDEITSAGSIHSDMFEHIVNDPVAIVDLTTLNPNVFYELGVRHALVPHVTVLIRAKDAPLPFNVAGLRTIDYEINRASRDAIRAFIEEGLRSRCTDSPVIDFAKKRKDSSEKISRLLSFPYRLRELPQKNITVLTGDIQERHGIDVWVNSENVYMQMSRFYDRGLSALIRYLGAKKDDVGVPVEDTIANELAAIMKGRESVPPGTICPTGAGDLEHTHGVKLIFHIAVTAGKPGGGWVQIADPERCVQAALRLAESKNMQSIAIPMIGTGSGGADVFTVAQCLIRAAISYLSGRSSGSLREVFFLAWNQRDLDACRAGLEAAEEAEPVKPARA